VYDDVRNHSGDNYWHYISSGSKAEGLDLPGSDFDVMLIKHMYLYNFTETSSITVKDK
jgi:hypothetical protein